MCHEVFMLRMDDGWDQCARVAILMGTRNGASYLPEQLASLARQTHANWVLLVSDDGSEDGTLELVEQFARDVGGGRVLIRQGPRKGFVANFLSMACHPGFDADFYAFCDQDDVWLPDKLERAIRALKMQGKPGFPHLYCGRTTFISGSGTSVGSSHPFVRPPVFANAVVQSIAGANTMVFDERARLLLVRGGPLLQVPSHDWWLYLLVSGCEGIVVYDPQPSVAYRQHGNNLQGGNTGILPRCSRLFRLLQGEFRIWNQMNLDALARVSDLLTAENVALLEAFQTLRQQRGWRACRALRRHGFFRQRMSDNLALLLAAGLGRL